MNTIEVGDLLKYNDGVEDFICVVIKIENNDVMEAHWLNNEQYDRFRRFPLRGVIPKFGWSKLS